MLLGTACLRFSSQLRWTPKIRIWRSIWGGAPQNLCPVACARYWHAGVKERDAEVRDALKVPGSFGGKIGRIGRKQELQKTCNPHEHLVIWHEGLPSDFFEQNVEEVDRLVCADLQSFDEETRALAKTFMTHSCEYCAAGFKTYLVWFGSEFPSGVSGFVRPLLGWRLILELLGLRSLVVARHWAQSLFFCFLLGLVCFWCLRCVSRGNCKVRFRVRRGLRRHFGARCPKGFPHKMSETTYFDENGWVVLKRRCPASRWLEPTNPQLLKRLKTHVVAGGQLLAAIKLKILLPCYLIVNNVVHIKTSIKETSFYGIF